MLKKKWLLFLSTLMATASLMCGFGAYDFDQDLFTKIEPDPQKMVGDYLPTEETLTLIAETGNYDLQNTSVSLFADGTFEMQDMPDWWLTDYGEPGGEVDAGKGKWTISEHNWWWQIYLKFDSVSFNSRPDLSSGFGTHKDISGEQPPYSLWFYVGDLDKGRVMVFEQVVENP
ncbi:MAG: hypothetical protein U9Q70_12685 [Chloroflexota bacterium]|nr:hypothetical protein [Chloroflexota bacterium]